MNNIDIFLTTADKFADLATTQYQLVKVAATLEEISEFSQTFVDEDLDKAFKDLIDSIGSIKDLLLLPGSSKEDVLEEVVNLKYIENAIIGIGQNLGYEGWGYEQNITPEAVIGFLQNSSKSVEDAFMSKFSINLNDELEKEQAKVDATYQPDTSEYGNEYDGSDYDGPRPDSNDPLDTDPENAIENLFQEEQDSAAGKDRGLNKTRSRREQNKIDQSKYFERVRLDEAGSGELFQSWMENVDTYQSKRRARIQNDPEFQKADAAKRKQAREKKLERVRREVSQLEIDLGSAHSDKVRHDISEQIGKLNKSVYVEMSDGSKAWQQRQSKKNEDVDSYMGTLRTFNLARESMRNKLPELFKNRMFNDIVMNPGNYSKKYKEIETKLSGKDEITDEERVALEGSILEELKRYIAAEYTTSPVWAKLQEGFEKSKEFSTAAKRLNNMGTAPLSQDQVQAAYTAIELGNQLSGSYGDIIPLFDKWVPAITNQIFKKLKHLEEQGGDITSEVEVGDSMRQERTPASTSSEQRGNLAPYAPLTDREVAQSNTKYTKHLTHKLRELKTQLTQAEESELPAIQEQIDKVKGLLTSHKDNGKGKETRVAARRARKRLITKIANTSSN